jgi:hypothetical protein
MADLDDAYECQVFSSTTTDFSVEGVLCGARTKTQAEMYQHYWCAHPQLLNGKGGLEITDLESGEEYGAAPDYVPLNEIQVAFCKRVLPAEFCRAAFENALSWLGSIVDAAEAGTLNFELVVRDYSAQSGDVMSVNPPPSASSPAAASSKQSTGTPATLPKPKPKPPAATAEAVPDFLKNKDLFGLEPALSVRTRILLACHAQSRMNMSLDIAKSFAIAGYFPRQRYACLQFAFFIMHLLYLQTSKAESISGRSGSSKWRDAARRKARFWSKT